MNSPAVIALDLGGTKLAAALFSASGTAIEKRRVALKSDAGDAVGRLIVRQVDRLHETAAKRDLNVAAVGICVPGIANPDSGRVWAPNIPGWSDYPLRREIRRALATNDIKIIVESDRTASILGEAWQGAAQGYCNVVFLAVGTGIGAGILVDGHVLHGAHNIAGAVGWLALERPFKRKYMDRGCFETYASGDGIARTAKALLSRRRGYHGSLRKRPSLTAHDVFAAYEEGDEIADEVLSQAVEVWGMASANLISLLNPEMIVFGGGVFGPAIQFIDAIAEEARRWAQPIAVQRVTFEPSQLGGDAALTGAAYLGLRAARLAPELAKARK